MATHLPPSYIAYRRRHLPHLQPPQHAPAHHHPFRAARCHARVPLQSPLPRHRRARLYPTRHTSSSAVGLALGTYAHTVGWPVIVGGSGALTAALVEASTRAGSGVQFTTSTRITSLRDLDAHPQRDVVILNTTPRFAADFLATSQQPRRIAKRYRRFRHGPAAYRIDIALRGDIPWLYDDARAPVDHSPRRPCGHRKRHCRKKTPRPALHACGTAIPRRPHPKCRKPQPHLGIRPRSRRIPG